MTVDEQIAMAEANYEAGAIDTDTFERAVADILAGVPNSYGQAFYGEDEHAWGAA